MLLAELEIWHSRPFTPTRRVALGNLVLPATPPPGFGGLLLGAVVAAHIDAIDEDMLGDVHRLVNEVERGDRVVQPRLRHRFQVDRHGLARSVHRMFGEGDDMSFEFHANGSALAQVLGAVYAVERLDISSRHALSAVLHKAMRWRGPIGPSMVAYLAGQAAASLAALSDPRAWALEILGFPSDTVDPSRRQVQGRFRSRLRDVHPDHGGDEAAASVEILNLSEARRILLS